MERLRSRYILYILALFCVGLAHLAMLPPYEGFDETAHYASARQVADVGTIPVRNASFLPRDVVGYSGPRPYGSLNPPFDDQLSYVKFSAAAEQAADFRQHYRTPGARPPFEASTMPNWQAQHPPLYYALLAAVLHITDGLPFVTELFVLRLVSYGLALGGVVLAIMAAQRASQQRNDTQSAVMAGFLLYPLILPMFFPEFARLGNDSLCLLLTGASAFCLVRSLEDERKRTWPLALGVVLGLGLLTKALFVPIVAAVALFCGARMWAARADRDVARRRAMHGALTVVLAGLIGGGWYLYHVLTYGVVSGSNDAAFLNQQGGLLANLDGDFSFTAVLRSVVVIVVTWSWTGTWSMVRMPPLMHLPLLVLLAWTVWAYLSRMPWRNPADPSWLPLYMFGAFGLGMLWHIGVGIVLTGNNGITGGHYLHLLLPWAAPALGAGAVAILHNPKQRRFFIALVIYAPLFHAAALWSQFALFTGCARKGDDKQYEFLADSFCLDRGGELFSRLETLAWPAIALTGLGLGLAVSAVLVAGSLGASTRKTAI